MVSLVCLKIISPVIDAVSATMLQSAKNLLENSSGSEISEGLCLLEALSIATRSIHNCRVFGYSGGVQKLTALMKGIIHMHPCIFGILIYSRFEYVFFNQSFILSHQKQILHYAVNLLADFSFWELDNSFQWLILTIATYMQSIGFLVVFGTCALMFSYLHFLGQQRAIFR